MHILPLMRRFICRTIPGVGEFVCLSDRESYHCQKVLRYRAGDRLCLIDGCGTEALALIDLSSCLKKESRVSCQILQKKTHSLPKIRYTLFVSPPKKIADFRMIVRQVVELGGWEIIPVISERCEAKFGQNYLSKLIVDSQEACKQCGNPFFPKIFPVLDFGVALKEATDGGIVGQVPGLNCDAGEPFKPHAFANFLKEFVVSGKERFGVWIGPEGGFTEDEIEKIVIHNNRPLILSPWTLKVGTAVNGTLSLLNFFFQCGDFYTIPPTKGKIMAG